MQHSYVVVLLLFKKKKFIWLENETVSYFKFCIPFIMFFCFPVSLLLYPFSVYFVAELPCYSLSIVTFHSRSIEFPSELNSDEVMCTCATC